MNVSIIAFAALTQIFPIPNQDAQLMILVEQGRLQVEELSKLLRSSQINNEQLRRATAISEKLIQGIDKELLPLQNSREFQAALIELQKKNSEDPMTPSENQAQLYRKYYPEEASQDERQKNNFESFQKNVVSANNADLQDIRSFEERMQKAQPGEIPKLNTQATSKIWEADLRVSIQMAELLNELRSLRSEIAHQRIGEKVEEAQMKEGLRKQFNISAGEARNSK